MLQQLGLQQVEATGHMSNRMEGALKPAYVDKDEQQSLSLFAMYR